MNISEIFCEKKWVIGAGPPSPLPSPMLRAIVIDSYIGYIYTQHTKTLSPL